MKKLLLLASLVLAAFVFVAPAYSQDNLSFYGDKITEDGAVAAAELPKMMKGKKEVNAKVKGKIMQTCAKKGCWMSVDLGNGEKMTVRFKDYAFFVPKVGAEGLDVVFEGVAKKEKRTAAELKHYAEDAGKSKDEVAKIKKDKEEIVFEASGVIIKGYQKN